MNLQLVSRGLSLGLAAGLLTLTTAADTASPGYETTTLAIPTGVTTYGTVSCTLSGGDIVTFDGTRVDRWTASGGFLTNLGVLTEGGYSSFILPKPNGTGVIFCHSGDFFTGVDGELFEASFTPGVGASSIAQITFAYDAVFLNNNEMIVSANTDGGGTNNDFLRVNVVTKTVNNIGNVNGPSGPVALRANGDLYYSPASLSFPAAAGSGSLVYWTAADLTAGTFLDDSNSTLWASGYDPIGDIAIDPDKDRIYVAEALYDATFALVAAGIRRARPNLAKAEQVLVATGGVSNLEFVDLGGAANFQAYQPGDGLVLNYKTTDFFSFADRVTIAPKRPTLTISGPGVSGLGSVTLAATDAPANGTLYLVFGLQSTMSATEQTYANPGYLFHTHLLPNSMRRLPFFIPTDANGAGSFTLFNDGSLTGLYGYQFLVGDGNATFLGSTNDATF